MKKFIIIIGVKKLLGLIWSKEKQIKDEVVTAYYNLYFNIDKTPQEIANNLIQILEGSDIT